jgi:hypothetical protein
MAVYLLICGFFLTLFVSRRQGSWKNSSTPNPVKNDFSPGISIIYDRNSTVDAISLKNKLFI